MLGYKIISSIVCKQQSGIGANKNRAHARILNLTAVPSNTWRASEHGGGSLSLPAGSRSGGGGGAPRGLRLRGSEWWRGWAREEETAGDSCSSSLAVRTSRIGSGWQLGSCGTSSGWAGRRRRGDGRTGGGLRTTEARRATWAPREDSFCLACAWQGWDGHQPTTRHDERLDLSVYPNIATKFRILKKRLVSARVEKYYSAIITLDKVMPQKK